MNRRIGPAIPGRWQNAVADVRHALDSGEGVTFAAKVATDHALTEWRRTFIYFRF